MNKYDGVNFSPITEEMSKQLSARTNYYMNNSSLFHDLDNDHNKIESGIVSQFQLTKKVITNPFYDNDKDQVEKIINEDIKMAKFAEQQSPLENRFNQRLSNVLEGDLTENDLLQKENIQKNYQRSNKSKSTSHSPKKTNIQMSYNQAPTITQQAKNKKKKKHRIFIQEQPFKVDGNTKSNGYQEYNPLQDRFLKGFFNHGRIKNLKKIEKINHPQKKADKNGQQSGQNSPPPDLMHANTKLQKTDCGNQLEYEIGKISIETQQLTEMYDNSKDIDKQNSQVNSASAASLSQQWSGYVQQGSDMPFENFLKKQHDKENINTVQMSNQNQRYSLNSQNSIVKYYSQPISQQNYLFIHQNKKRKRNTLDSKLKVINKSTDLSLHQYDTSLIPYQNKLPLHPRIGIQNIMVQSPLGSQQNTTKYKYLPRIQTALSQENNLNNLSFSGQQSTSPIQNQGRHNNLISQSQDFQGGITKKKKKIPIQTRQKFYSIYQNQRTESPLMNRNDTSFNNNTLNNVTSKPYCNLNGIQVQLPKSNKTQQQQKHQIHLLLPSFNLQNYQQNQLQQKLLNQSLNIGSSKFENVDLSFQDKGNQGSIKNQINWDKQQYYPDREYDRDIKHNNVNGSQKLTQTLTKLEFHNFIDSFKKKYSPSCKMDSLKSNYFSKQQNLYESKLLKEYKDSITHEESL